MNKRRHRKYPSPHSSPKSLESQGQPTELPLDAIHVGERHRRDLGDIDALAANIQRVGLLQPIVVTPDGFLLCGERRLRAAKLLGWKMIPVTIVTAPIESGAVARRGAQ